MRKATVIRRLAKILPLGLALAASSPAPAADPPRRVVSFNICADQLVVALADPAQIAGLSPYATDPTLSAVAGEARAFPRIQWHAGVDDTARPRSGAGRPARSFGDAAAA